MLIPFAILSIVAILILLFSVVGRRIDDHPVCRRCRFDLIGLPQTICPECGAKLDAPKAIRIGQRRRYRRLAIFSIFLLVVGAAGSGLSIYGSARKVDWYTYKPVWWLRLDAKYGSTEVVTHAVNEILVRRDNSKLSAGDLEAVVSTLSGALESGHLPTPVIYGHALSELLSGPGLSQAARDRLIAWILTLQSDRAKPWSSELGNTFLAEGLAKRIPEELVSKFLSQACQPELYPLLHRPLRPGESTPIVLNLNPRSGNATVRYEFSGGLSETAAIGRDATHIPAPGLSIVGTLTAPKEPGSYTFDGTIRALFNAEDLSNNRGMGRRSFAPAPEPQAKVEWPLHFPYQVADSLPQDPFHDMASRIFTAGGIQPEPGSRMRAWSCPIFVVSPTVPMSVEFDVLWRYQGADTPVGSGTLALTRNGFSSSHRTQGFSGSSSSFGTSSGPRPRPERYLMTVPMPAGPATTGAIVIHITALTFDGSPNESFAPFDLELPDIKVHW